jgi:adenosylcobinamide-GDP ribazoletransferase
VGEFLVALRFLTRVPVPALVPHDAAALARSTPWFPAVGVLVGVVGALAFAAGSVLWSPSVAAFVATGATVWLTGAFHEDGLADAADGLGGGWTAEQVLSIMKDSRIGSYGAVALVLVIGTKVSALAAIGAHDALPAARALVVGHVLGRWSSLPLLYWLPYVREQSATGKPFAGSVTVPRLVAGSAFALGVMVWALGWRALAAGLAASVVTALAGTYFRRRLGGLTGDCLGAANQLVELATYLAVLAARGGAPWPV